MKFASEISPGQAENDYNTSIGFQYSLQQLENYVAQSHDEKLAKSFEKFKQALSSRNEQLANAAKPKAQWPGPDAALPEPQDRSYLAMSSLFTVNVKHP